MIYKLENEKERDIIIDHRFYRNIIGSKGDNIREIREMFNQVQITFPGPGKLFLGVLRYLCGVITLRFLLQIWMHIVIYNFPMFRQFLVTFSDERFNSFY
jgi:hypothetical protein